MTVSKSIKHSSGAYIPTCPICGGSMESAAFGRGNKVCTSCGAQLTSTEYDQLREANHRARMTPDEQRHKDHQEYLNWYESSKN
jgi:tRNA(Ile2) C34 agmatinyltransferase TiaS